MKKLFIICFIFYGFLSNSVSCQTILSSWENNKNPITPAKSFEVEINSKKIYINIDNEKYKSFAYFSIWSPENKNNTTGGFRDMPLGEGSVGGSDDNDKFHIGFHKYNRLKDKFYSDGKGAYVSVEYNGYYKYLTLEDQVVKIALEFVKHQKEVCSIENYF